MTFTAPSSMQINMKKLWACCYEKSGLSPVKLCICFGFPKVIRGRGPIPMVLSVVKWQLCNLPSLSPKGESKYLSALSSSEVSSLLGFPGGSVVKNMPADAGEEDSIPGSGRSPEGGNGNPLQYSCLGNPINRGALQATVHGVTKKSDTTEKRSMHTRHHYY